MYICMCINIFIYIYNIHIYTDIVYHIGITHFGLGGVDLYIAEGFLFWKHVGLFLIRNTLGILSLIKV